MVLWKRITDYWEIPWWLSYWEEDRLSETGYSHNSWELTEPPLIQLQERRLTWWCSGGNWGCQTSLRIVLHQNYRNSHMTMWSEQGRLDIAHEDLRQLQLQIRQKDYDASPLFAIGDMVWLENRWQWKEENLKLQRSLWDHTKWRRCSKITHTR